MQKCNKTKQKNDNSQISLVKEVKNLIKSQHTNKNTERGILIQLK